MTTSPSRRIRVAIPESEYVRLSWLAGQSGNDISREAGLLLVLGIRRAVERWRKLLGRPEVSPADLETLRRAEGTPDWLISEIAGDHGTSNPPVGRNPPTVGPRPLTLPDWDQPQLPGMPPEVP